MVKRKRPQAKTAAVKLYFDHQAFPTIVDNILRHASWSVLCAFRRTSKYYCDKADAILGEHVVLSTYQDSVMRVTSPYGLVPTLRNRHYTEWARPGGKKSIAALEKAKRTFARTRVVDLIGSGDISLMPIATMLTNVKTLRVSRDWLDYVGYKVRIKAEKLVLFSHNGNYDPYHRKPETVVQQWVKKLVIKVKYHLADMKEGDGFGPIFPVHLDEDTYANVDELVVIFTDSHPEEEEEGTDGDDWDPRVYDYEARNGLNRFEHLTQGIAQAATAKRPNGTRLKITIVDFQTVDFEWLDMQPSSAISFGAQEEEYVVAELLKGVGELIPAMRAEAGQVDDDDAAALKSIEFVTGAEYEARIGPEEFLIETVETRGDDL